MAGYAQLRTSTIVERFAGKLGRGITFCPEQCANQYDAGVRHKQTHVCVAQNDVVHKGSKNAKARFYGSLKFEDNHTNITGSPFSTAQRSLQSRHKRLYCLYSTLQL